VRTRALQKQQEKELNLLESLFAQQKALELELSANHLVFHVRGTNDTPRRYCLNTWGLRNSLKVAMGRLKVNEGYIAGLRERISNRQAVHLQLYGSDPRWQALQDEIANARRSAEAARLELHRRGL
jgi:hypothetical protein